MHDDPPGVAAIAVLADGSILEPALRFLEKTRRLFQRQRRVL
jgi:hypothetical protein